MSELYQLPDGWEWKKFEDLFTITSSKRVHKKDWLSNGIPFYRAREIVKLSKNGFVDNELFLSNEMYNSFIEKYGIPKENDILVTGVGTLGIPYVVKSNDKFYFKDGNIIWFKNENNTNSKYIEYGFQSEFIKNQINSNSGSTVGTYTITNANNTIIPLPPLEEQKRIVSKLDTLFEKIDKSISLHQKNIDEANVFMASVLNDVFSELEERYEKISLFDVANVNRGKSKHRPRNDKKLFGGDYPFIQTGDVRNANKYIDTFSETYSEFGLSQSQLWGKGTICMTIAANIDDVAILNIDSCFPDSVVGIYSENHSNDFLYYFLLTLKQQLESKATTTAQMNINLKVLQTIGVPLPPLQTQQKVVTYLDEISQKMNKIKQIQKEKMQSLKASKP